MLVTGYTVIPDQPGAFVAIPFSPVLGYRPPPKLVWAIYTLEAMHSGVSVAMMLSAMPRSRKVVRARWRAWKRLRDYNYSLPAIGRAVGRDHTTVLYGLRRLKELEDARAQD